MTTQEHIEAEVLAAFVDGRLAESETNRVLAHLDRCASCRFGMEMANETIAAESPEPAAARPRTWLLATAAVFVIAIAATPLVLTWRERQPMRELVSLAPRQARIAEPRLTGGFAWAAYRGPMRSTGADSEARRMKLVGAAGDLVERADAEKTGEAQHAAGIGLVLADKPEEAMARLRLAAEGLPNAARAWSDLAAAEYTTALRLGRASLYPVALAHADRALRIDARSAEALFNRALILERLGLPQFAREAWSRYLEVDPSSPWSNEARERLRRLPASTIDSQFRRDLPLLERAALRGDAQAVDAIVDRYRQQARSWGEAEYLGRWADGDAAGRNLIIARAIGDALVRLSGETMLRDAVTAIDSAPPARRTMIAEAHSAYRRGRRTYSRREPAAAEPDLRLAAGRFAQAGDPMALVARYYAACMRFDQNDAATARRELDALRGETTYAALGAQIGWELALCAIREEDWTAAALLSQEAAGTFARLGEQSNLAFLQAIRATALIVLGRPDEGWDLRAKAFTVQSGEGRGDRLPQSLSDAARIELRTGRMESARALLEVEAFFHRSAADDVELSNALTRAALLGMTAGDVDEAAHDARQAMTAAERIADPALRARAMADANVAAGACALPDDPPRARAFLSAALEHYRSTKHWFYVPEALLLRGRAWRRDGNADAALRDLDEGIDAVGSRGGELLDVRRELFAEAIALRLDRGDVAGAFAAADRARTRISSAPAAGAGVASLQEKLRGTDTAVLTLSVLPREIVAFFVTAGGVTAARRGMAPDRAGDMARDMTSIRDDRELYDLLIRPAAPSLRRWRHLIVVADPPLQHVPFAALLDGETNRRVIETMTVAMAPSAGALEPAAPGAASRSVAAIALPTGERSGTVALPEGQFELADVVRGYPRALEIAPERASLSTLADAAANADVIHIAGHTERQPGSGEDALLFRGRGAHPEPVTWSRIAAMKIRSPVVVLAACDTLRAPPSPQTGALSLGAGFLAAGAHDVIGTLTPIADGDARTLFSAVHRELARGRSSAAALQTAQHEAMAADSQAWRSMALLTNRIDPEKRGDLQ